MGKQSPSQLQLASIIFIQEAMFIDYSGKFDYIVDYGALATTLDVGDNFVVNAKFGNSKGQDLWIVLCIRRLNQVKKASNDKWGTSFEVGDEMVTSLYYKNWGTSEHTYVLLKDSHLVFMHSYFVCGMQLLLPPKHY